MITVNYYVIFFANVVLLNTIVSTLILDLADSVGQFFGKLVRLRALVSSVGH